MKWGAGGAVVFPAVVLLIAYYKDALLPYPSAASHLLDRVLEVLSFPLRIWDAVLPKHGDPTEMAKWFWIPIWTSWIVYLACLGFGVGVLLRKAVKPV
jgi:hypothetical protein